MADRIGGAGPLNRDELLRRATQGRPLTNEVAPETPVQRPGESGVESPERLRALQGLLGREPAQVSQRVVQRDGPGNLGAASRMALDAELRAGSPGSRARDHFGGFDLQNWESLQEGKVDMRDAQARDALPDNVKESYDYYFNRAEANDWGTVRVLKREVEGDPVYLVATTTDGSDAYMELFSESGDQLGSGQQMEGERTDWDARFGACRQHLEQYG